MVIFDVNIWQLALQKAFHRWKKIDKRKLSFSCGLVLKSTNCSAIVPVAVAQVNKERWTTTMDERRIFQQFSSQCEINFHLESKVDGARRKMENHSGSISKSTHDGTTELIAFISKLLEFECWFSIWSSINWSQHLISQIKLMNNWSFCLLK